MKKPKRSHVAKSPQSISQDRIGLAAAANARNGDGWEVLYFAKRLLQINTEDSAAEEAVLALRMFQFSFTDLAIKGKDLCPLFGHLAPLTRLSLVKEGELIERESGSLICEQGDAGDTLFVVLKGEVSVQVEGKTLARVSRGQIVGELAFALRRSRTATLRTIGQTALLSLSASRIRALLRTRPDIFRTINSFIIPRVLNLICHRTNYFEPPAPNTAKLKAQVIVNKLSSGAKLLNLSMRDTTNGSFTKDHPKLKANGLYLLVGGKLSNGFAPEHTLVDDEYPIVFSLCKGGLVDQRRTFVLLEGYTTLLFIPQSALQNLGQSRYSELLDRLKRHLAEHYVFDVFISYNSGHHLDTAQRWKSAFEEKELTVFLDPGESNIQFKKVIGPAILDSRVFLPLLSGHTLGPDSWVQREINYRKTAFHEDNCAMIPIKLDGAKPKEQVDGYSVIDAVGREREAIQEAIAAVLEVKKGKKVPFATNGRYPESI
jgi:CRP-like cAMP-binding protein